RPCTKSKGRVSTKRCWYWRDGIMNWSLLKLVSYNPSLNWSRTLLSQYIKMLFCLQCGKIKVTLRIQAAVPRPADLPAMIPVFLSPVGRSLAARLTLYTGARAVTAPGVEITHYVALAWVVIHVEAAPDEHFRVGPDRRVPPSGARGIVPAGGRP